MLIGILLLICSAATNAHPPGKDLHIPQKYSMKGHFDVVFGSVSQPLEVKTDAATHRQVISFYDGLHSTLVRDTFYAYVYTRKTERSCMSYNAPAFLRPSLTNMLPVLEDFTFVEEVIENGMTLYHYAYEQVLRPSEDYNGTFTYARTDHQDFYCLPLNSVDGKLYCQPRRWEMHGYNQWTGSHFDFYVLSYDAFDIDPLFTDADFATPESCNEKSSATEFCPRSLLEEILTNYHEPRSSDDQEENIRLDPSHTFTVSRTRMSETDFKLFMRARTGLVRKTVEQERIARETQYFYEDIPEHSDTWYYSEENQKRVQFPRQLDWRVRGVITPVKDQAACGSCWSFGAAGTIEGRLNALRWNRGERNAPLLRVSEQSIISCVWNEQNNGCNGGLTYEALTEYINEFSGRIAYEVDSPYLAVESLCNESIFTSDYGRIRGVAHVKEYDIGAMKYALLSGPVSIAVAVTETFSWYSGGVFNDPACGNGIDDLGHAVLLVGWGTDEVAGDYWIVRNSWSNAWGIDGYMYLSMKNNVCGVLTCADYVMIE